MEEEDFILAFYSFQEFLNKILGIFYFLIKDFSYAFLYYKVLSSEVLIDTYIFSRDLILM